MQSRSAVPPDTGELVRAEVKSKIMQTSVLNVGLHCKSKIKQCTRCRCCCCCSSAICRSSSSFLIADSSRRRTSFKTWKFNIAMQYDWSKLAVWPERNCQMSLKVAQSAKNRTILSHWFKLVTWHATANQNALFQSRVITLLLKFYIWDCLHSTDSIRLWSTLIGWCHVTWWIFISSRCSTI